MKYLQSGGREEEGEVMVFGPEWKIGGREGFVREKCKWLIFVIRPRHGE